MGIRPALRECRSQSPTKRIRQAPKLVELGSGERLRTISEGKEKRAFEMVEVKTGKCAAYPEVRHRVDKLSNRRLPNDPDSETDQIECTGAIAAKERPRERGWGPRLSDIRALTGVESEAEGGLERIELQRSIAAVEDFAEGGEDCGGNLFEGRPSNQATPRSFRGLGEAARSAPHGAGGKPSHKRKCQPPKYSRAECKQAELPTLEWRIGSDDYRQTKTQSGGDDHRHTNPPQGPPSRIEPSKVPEPDQGGHPELDRNGEHAGERTEPGVR
jgi:hypothetical protein